MRFRCSLDERRRSLVGVLRPFGTVDQASTEARELPQPLLGGVDNGPSGSSKWALFNTHQQVADLDESFLEASNENFLPISHLGT